MQKTAKKVENGANKNVALGVNYVISFLKTLKTQVFPKNLAISLLASITS
jgi:hypothetical protein